ncbi:hypothetical protein tb265_38990 [Gemmatimonadetes bacterium T265]|nr:hypothetical protein tb265_38990 [Gemmatimonadetes bacterium T265]
MPSNKQVSPTLEKKGFVNEDAAVLLPGLAVKYGQAEHGCARVAAANGRAMGVVALDQAQGQGDMTAVHIGFGEACYVRAGAAFAYGAYLTTDATGRWVTAASGQLVQAESLGAAAAIDDLVGAIRHSGLSVAP